MVAPPNPAELLPRLLDRVCSARDEPVHALLVDLVGRLVKAPHVVSVPRDVVDAQGRRARHLTVPVLLRRVVGQHLDQIADFHVIYVHVGVGVWVGE